MTAPNTEAVLREFPFLRTHFGGFPIRVERLDESLVLRTPSTAQVHDRDDWLGDMVLYRTVIAEQIFLFDETGNLLGEVGKKKVAVPAHRIFFGLIRVPEAIVTLHLIGETIWQAVRRFENIAHYIVAPSPESAHTLILYKPPKGFPRVADWMEELTRRAQATIRKQIAEIDQEAGL